MIQQQPRPQVPAIGTVEDGYRFLGGDPASESSWEQVVAPGQRLLPSGPVAGDNRSEQAYWRARRTQSDPAVLQAEQGVAASRRAEGLLRRQEQQGGIFGGTGGIYSVPVIGNIAGLFDPEIRELDAIQARQARLERQPGEGAISDFDAQQFVAMTYGRDKPMETNRALIQAQRVANDAVLQRREFEEWYFSQFGTANGAQEAWRVYAQQNPIFDPASQQEGAQRLNPSRMSWREYFTGQPGLATQAQMDLAASAAPNAGPTNPATGLPSYPTIAALTANAQEFPIPERQAAPVVDLQTASRDEIIAALRAGGTFRDGPDGQPYSLPPQEPQFGPAQEGDRMAQPGVAVRPQPGFMATPMAGPIRGAMEFARNIPAFAQSFTERVPFADEAAAALVGLTSGRGYGEIRSLQERLAQQDREERPLARNLGGIAGAIAPAAIPAATGAQWVANAPNLGYQVTRGIAAGIPVGALYGAADAEGGLQERAGAAVQGGIAGGITGGALPVAGRAAERTIEGARGLLGNRAFQSPDAQTLSDAGVFVTPGAQAGGMLRSIENLAQRAPILGPAIAGARGRSVDSLNRGVANTVLSRIEQGLPAEVQPGAEAVDFVARALGAEFDRAAAAIPTTQADDAFMQGIANVAQREVDLPESARAQFRSIIQDRLTRLNGPVTGRQLRAIESELGQVASQVQDRQLADMLLSVQDEVQGLMERASPEAAAILNRVRPAYREFVVMRRASQAAGGNPFSPSQLLTAVRGEDSSVGNSLTARGQAPLQDLARAARNVIPDQYGNPGTADAVGLGALGVTAITNPAAGIGAAAGLGAAALPYMAMGRRIVESLPERPSEQQVTAALNQLEQLAAVEPGIRQVQQELMDRLRIGFATTAAATAGQSAAN